jgi:hypothetical protein
MDRRRTRPWTWIAAAVVAAALIAGASRRPDLEPMPSTEVLAGTTAVVGDLTADERDEVTWALGRFRRGGSDAATRHRVRVPADR